MNTVEKVFTTVGVIGTVTIAAFATEAATIKLTDTANPANLYLYLRFKVMADDIEDRGDGNFLAVKQFVNSHNCLNTLTCTQTQPLMGAPIDEFNFYESWRDVPLQIKNDPTRLTDWDAVRRYIVIQERNIKERKAREEMKFRQQMKNGR